MICPKCGAIHNKMLCEVCVKKLSDQAYLTAQKRFMNEVAADKLNLTIVRIQRPGIIEGLSWHAQQFINNRRTFCGFSSHPRGVTPEVLQIRYSKLPEIKPFCEACRQRLAEVAA